MTILNEFPAAAGTGDYAPTDSAASALIFPPPTPTTLEPATAGRVRLPSRKARSGDQGLALPREVRVRVELAEATTSWKAAISRFGAYVDTTGQASSGARGLALQVSRRIKEAFGGGYDDLDMPGQVAVAGLLLRLEETVVRGAAREQPRRVIKDAVYAAIARSGAAYVADREVFGDD